MLRFYLKVIASNRQDKPFTPARITKGGTRGTVFRDVARLRLGDAKSLLAQGRYNGAIYLAGYAIECHLKHAVCRRQNVIYLPPSLEVHDWDMLMKAARLFPDIKVQRHLSVLYDSLAEKWGPALRYRTGNYTRVEASHLYKEIFSVYQFLIELEP